MGYQYSLSRKLGQFQEQQALDFLIQRGLRAVTRNYHCKSGEIDLIMFDKDILVFVEVRFRCNNSYGGSLASVTKFKQHKLIRASLHYLQKNRLYNKCPCRFDVVAITGKTNKIEWIKDAFWVQY